MDFFNPHYNINELRTGNILQKSLKSAGIKIKKIVMEIPDLLLAYTYFLDKCHSTHITVGYDNENFTLRIILYKNSMFHTLLEDDWNVLFKNSQIIDDHFSNKLEADFAELPHTSKAVQFKLSIRKEKKCLISVENNKKLILNAFEWKKLNEFIPYINSIVKWYSFTKMEIQRYYDRYLQLCIENNIYQLLPQHFFVTSEQSHYYYNSSRIFYEMPIICKEKLRNDLCQYYNNV